MNAQCETRSGKMKLVGAGCAAIVRVGRVLTRGVGATLGRSEVVFVGDGADIVGRSATKRYRGRREGKTKERKERRETTRRRNK